LPKVLALSKVTLPRGLWGSFSGVCDQRPHEGLFGRTKERGREQKKGNGKATQTIFWGGEKSRPYWK